MPPKMVCEVLELYSTVLELVDASSVERVLVPPMKRLDPLPCVRLPIPERDELTLKLPRLFKLPLITTLAMVVPPIPLIFPPAALKV